MSDQLDYKTRKAYLRYIYKNLRKEDWDAFIGFGAGLVARKNAERGEAMDWNIHGWQYAFGFVAALQADPSPELLSSLVYDDAVSANTVADLAQFEPPAAVD